MNKYLWFIIKGKKTVLNYVLHYNPHCLPVLQLQQMNVLYYFVLTGNDTGCQDAADVIF